MKAIRLICMALLTPLLMVSCDKEVEPGDPRPSMCTIFGAEKEFMLNVSPLSGNIIGVVVDSYNTHNAEYNEWLESMKPTCDNLYKQILDNGGRQDCAYTYAYATLKGLSLTADAPLFDEAAGDELINYFDIKIDAFQTPLFYYSNTTMVEGGINNEMLFAVNDYVDGGYLMTTGFYLVPKPEVATQAIPTKVQLSLKVALSTGATQTKVFTMGD